MEPRRDLISSSSAVEPSPSPTSPIAPSSSRSKRRRNAGPAGDCCRICRARKVRCPGNPGYGPCANCARLELECSFVEENEASRVQGKVSRTTPSRSHTEAGTVRRRAQRACHNCHIHKTKCSGELPFCKRCEVNSLVCEYMPTKRNFASVSYTGKDAGSLSESSRSLSHAEAAWPAPSVASSESLSTYRNPEPNNLAIQANLMNRSIVLQHFTTWFTFVHPTQSYGFLHPATTYREIEEGSYDLTTCAAVCAVAGLFLNSGPDGRVFADHCNHLVKYQLAQSAGVFSKQRLVYLVLSCLYDLMIGDWPKVWEHSATASRLVTALRLNRESSDGSVIDQESVRRLTWQVFITDRVLAQGFSEHLTMSADKLFLQMPSSDRLFDEHNDRTVERLDLEHSLLTDPLAPMSLRAMCIRLHALRHEILNATKKFGVAPTSSHGVAQTLNTPAVMDDIHRIQQQLDTIRGQLPVAMQLSETSISSHSGLPSWGTFFMLHTLILHLYQELYRFALPHQPGQAISDIMAQLAPTFLAAARFHVVGFAVVQSRFWETCHELNRSIGTQSGLLTGDHLFPTCVVQTTKILVAARQQGIFFDLPSNSTVPPFRNENFDDAALAKMIDLNLGILTPFLKIMPAAEEMGQSLNRSIGGHRDSGPSGTYESLGMFEMPFPSSPEVMRPSPLDFNFRSMPNSQIPVDERRRKERTSALGSALSAAQSYHARRGSSPLSGTSTQDHHDGPLDYVLRPPNTALGLPQLRAVNVRSITMPPNPEAPVPAHLPSQFHALGVTPGMGGFVGQPLPHPPQNGPLTGPPGYGPRENTQLFLGQPPPAHFELASQHLDLLTGYGTPYPKPDSDQTHDYMPYQNYRS